MLPTKLLHLQFSMCISIETLRNSKSQCNCFLQLILAKNPFSYTSKNWCHSRVLGCTLENTVRTDHYIYCEKNLYLDCTHITTQRYRWEHLAYYDLVWHVALTVMNSLNWEYHLPTWNTCFPICKAELIMPSGLIIFIGLQMKD